MTRRGRAARLHRPAGRVIMGRNCLQEALRHCPEQIVEVYLADQRRLDRRGKELAGRVQALGISARCLDDAELTELAGSSSHQSFVALMRDDRSGDLRRLIAQCEGKERACLVLLDSVSDPHNLGAILRAAECFGVDGVVWSRNRGAPLSAVASKVSVGASEILPIAQVANLVEAARRIKEGGFWLVGAEAAAESANLDKFDFPGRCALVLGAEDDGLQPLLVKQLDYRVRIAMQGEIDSLNVSQAAAVFLYAWRRGLPTLSP